MALATASFLLFGGCMLVARLVLAKTGLVQDPMCRDLASIMVGDMFAALILAGIFASWVYTGIGFLILAGLAVVVKRARN